MPENTNNAVIANQICNDGNNNALVSSDCNDGNKHERRFMMKYKKQLAFTLAEVLITLGIIGVIAAITVPVLVTKYQKMVTVNKLKMAYNIVQNAIKMSENENTELVNWDTTLEGKAFFERYLSKYIKTISNYTDSELNRKVTYIGLDDKPLDDGPGRLRRNSQSYMLPNSILISIYKLEPGEILLYIDINGFLKPNQLGKDLFCFRIMNGMFYASGMIPRKDENPNRFISMREFIKNNNTYNRGCRKGYRGFNCAALIIIDGWEIKNDYPW